MIRAIGSGEKEILSSWGIFLTGEWSNRSIMDDIQAGKNRPRQQGERFDLLLGNHEPMIFGDGYEDMLTMTIMHFVRIWGLDYSELFDEATVLGSWLRQKPLVISINNYLFVHGRSFPGIDSEPVAT